MTTRPDSHSFPSKPTFLGRVWAFLRILNVRLRFIFIMLLVGVVSAYWDDLMNHYDRWRRPTEVTMTESTAAGIEYFCPMHPNIVRADPGNCPICGMPLSKREKGHAKELPAGVLAQVQLTPLKVRMGRIATSGVDYRLLNRELRTVGIVDYDETRRAFIASRIKGRIDKLFVNYNGQRVEKGDPLVSLYSPELLTAQEELLQAVRGIKESDAIGIPALKEAALESLAASRGKLLLWGLTQEQLDEIEGRGASDTHLTIYSPASGIVTEKNVLEGHYVDEGTDLYAIADLSRVWIQVKVFEREIAGIELGTAVEVRSVAFPDEVLIGKVTFIAYTVDPSSRTLAARVEVDNPEYKLRPGMYVTAALRLPLGQVTVVDPAAPRNDSSAPSDTTAELARSYLALASLYAQDKTDHSAIEELLRQTQRLAEEKQLRIHEKAAVLAVTIRTLSGKELRGQREAFKKVSDGVIEVLKESPPAGMPLHLVYCPMAPGYWLAPRAEIVNPYYGAEMLSCGELKGLLTPASLQEDQQFVWGYRCPLHPAEVRAEPGECPIDHSPLQYAKMAKTLAVPESAVINTGTRHIVYRESSPGVFDMVEVQVGPRAGDYFPVLSGLNPGEHVATRGAFLVDAENRLNPSASVQYFGASGGGQGHQP